MTRSLIRVMAATAMVLAFWTPVRQGGPLWARAEATTLADAGGNWILLGLVADASGGPSQWRDEPGFVFPGGSGKPDRVVKAGDRVQLTVPKSIRTTNAPGQRPFEREVANFDTTGEYKVGTVLQVQEIGRKPMSKAGDRRQCWVRVAEGGAAKNH
jgi:hypothetical protein